MRNMASRMEFALVLLSVVALMSSVHQVRTEELPVIRARIDIKPDVLHLTCPRNLIACYVELPEGYRPSSIDVSSIRLNRTFVPMRQFTIGDFDNDGIPDLCVVFERTPVVRYILRSAALTQIVEQRSVTATLSVIGYLKDGTAFRGIDTLSVIIRPIKEAL